MVKIEFNSVSPFYKIVASIDFSLCTCTMHVCAHVFFIPCETCAGLSPIGIWPSRWPATTRSPGERGETGFPPPVAPTTLPKTRSR